MSFNVARNATLVLQRKYCLWPQSPHLPRKCMITEVWAARQTSCLFSCCRQLIIFIFQDNTMWCMSAGLTVDVVRFSLICTGMSLPCLNRFAGFVLKTSHLHNQQSKWQSNTFKSKVCTYLYTPSALDEMTQRSLNSSQDLMFDNSVRVQEMYDKQLPTAQQIYGEYGRMCRRGVDLNLASHFIESITRLCCLCKLQNVSSLLWVVQLYSWYGPQWFAALFCVLEILVDRLAIQSHTKCSVAVAVYPQYPQLASYSSARYGPTSILFAKIYISLSAGLWAGKSL